jgi:hypothetical protein
MNILIKLMSIVSLVLAPTLASFHGDGTAGVGQAKGKKEIKIGTKEAAPINAATAVYIK